MAIPEHLAMLKEGKEKWNEWRRANPEIKIDLSDANLSNLNLTRIDLFGANLSRTNFYASYLNQADFRKAVLYNTSFNTADLRYAYFKNAHFAGTIFNLADLTGANFNEVNLSAGSKYIRSKVSFYKAKLIGANLRYSNLSYTVLSHADLTRADLTGANLYGAFLFNANFDHAQLNDTILSNTNLMDVVNLENCFHSGPSGLDFLTLKKSGFLPIAFLRGCGLSDTLIDYFPSLLNQPIQFYSCFISYSSKDEDFAKRLHADLQNNGVRCWFAPEDMKAGRKLHEQIVDAILLHEKLLLILSEHSMNSEWVKTEIAKARQREVKDKRQVLFPVGLAPFEKIKEWECHDSDTGKDSAKEIREYYIPDFSNWRNHDAYQEAFNRLLKDLKPELERKPGL